MRKAIFSHSCLLASIITFSIGCSPKKENNQGPLVEYPNIVWIVLEDQSSDFFPMYGDSTIRLPQIEKLSGQSIIYQNAHSPAPVCAPARSSIITGMYPTTLGTHNMRCYNAYNSENQPGINIPSYSPVVPANVQPFTHYLRAAGYYCTNNAKEDYNFRTLPSMWDDSGNTATWRNRESEQPFFSVFNIEVTHESRIWGNGDKKLFVDPKDIYVPPYFSDDSITRHDLAVNYSNLLRADDQVGEILKKLKEDELFEDAIIFFYADHGGPFPRHKRALYETGTKVPMMVKLSGQEERTFNDNLISFIDLAPTMLSLAKIDPPSYLQGRAFLGSYMDGKAEYLFTASDRFDESYDRLRSVRSDRFKYIRNFYPQKPYALSISYRMNMPLMQNLVSLKQNGRLDSIQQLWMANEKPVEELYDLASDPMELNNLVNDPAYEEVKEELQQALNAWIRESDDKGAIDERELMEEWLNSGAQPILRSPKLEMVRGEFLQISNPVPGATSILKAVEDSVWQIYSVPFALEENMDIRIKSVRIGFQDSPEVSFQN